MTGLHVRLVRRGVDHGRFEPRESIAAESLAQPAVRAACAARWAADSPIVLSGALDGAPTQWGSEIAASLALFELLRRGASFQDAVWSRLARQRTFVPAGSSVDASDAREVEKVFAHATRRGRVIARDLYAKLSWIANDERDTSLRIRFSFGAEALLDWQKETRRVPWAERFAASVFPECAAVTSRRPLVRTIERLLGRRARFSERIIYNNAPGGGALFHHDDEEHQLGVVFSQLAGETAWLALPKRELAAAVARCARGALQHRVATPRRALRALDDTSDIALSRLINATPRFTRHLVELGALVRLRPGDSILLPTHGPDDTCWHSVFALGRRPSLAHSYGIFARRR